METEHFHSRAVQFAKEYLALVKKHRVCICYDWADNDYIADLDACRTVDYRMMDNQWFKPSGADISRGVNVKDDEVRMWLGDDEIFEEG